MGAHMKTTIEIAPALLENAKRLARREGVTLRRLVEEGLRAVLAARTSRPQFRLKDASFKGRGLQPGMEEGKWSEIREHIYEGRGA
jgi:hypothetical protein